ncbi:AAA family ATPase [archaeon]|jgi:DNA repair protein SbcC/Rad50|nr:AAA family ATPase [archaeon]
MIIKKITLENIRSYENEEIEFQKGRTLLAGDIGSGKTSILLAIEFGLFGLQPGQRGSALLRNGAETGGVKLEIQVEEKHILIERTLKKGKTISQDYAAITIEGEKQELSVTELKSRILGILNYPSEFSKKQNILYKFTVYTPQEEMKQIILEDSETRLNTLRHIFGIDKYKKILENVSILRASLREEKRLFEGITSNMEEDKQELKKKEENLESMKQDLQKSNGEVLIKVEKRKIKEKEKQEIEEKIQEKNHLREEAGKSKILLISKKDTRTSNERLMEILKKEIQEFKDLQFNELQIYEIEEELLNLKKLKDKFNEKNLEINSSITTLKIKQEEAKKVHDKISNLESCPTCYQKVDSVYRANILNKAHNDVSQSKNTIEELEFEKKLILEKIKSNEIESSLKEKKLTDLKILKMKLEGIKEKEIRLTEIKKSNEDLAKDLDFLQRHVNRLTDSMLEFAKYDIIYEEKSNELRQALKEEKIAEITFAELKKEIQMFEKSIEELKTRIDKIQEIKKKLDYLSELEMWLNKKFMPVISFIEKNVMVSLKKEFSKLFAEWFNMLVPENFNVRLSDDFTPIVEQQDYEIDYAYLSGGERTAIALAYRLALNQVINSLMSKIKTKELVILDEPTDGFSEQQLDKMREVLDELNVQQLIIVSHEQKMESFVENVIRFKKDYGVSGKE